MDYQRAIAQLTGRCIERRKVDNNTWLVRREGHVALRLHNTDILKYWPDGSVEYYAGNWQTWTTKDRLNKFGPLRIYSDRGVWLTGRNGSTVAFEDGMRVMADGTITGAGEDPGKTRKERKAIAAFAKRYMDALEAGKVPAPSGADCWFCTMKESKTGLPLGDAMEDRTHLQAHMDESYFVPSLLRNALESSGASRSMWWWVGSWWDQEATDEQRKGARSFNDRPRVEKALRRYMLKALGYVA